MVNFEMFLLGLLVSSAATGLSTEAVKKILDEHNKTYRANTLAGIISIVISISIGIGYVAITSTSFNSQIAVCLISLVFMSWLCAMVGYDKVIQTIGQFKTSGKE